jgi:hypothetical protein
MLRRATVEENQPMNDSFETKAPQDVLFDVPQERLTGDVLRGRGPRRGNLERLLRYWRPIMRKPGGFRRCRVILANHPELYPLERICAWLHHETTGLWPNEGCHHPGMKNCRRKLRGVTRGSIWSDSEFDDRLRRVRKLSKPGKKSMFGGGYDVVTEADFKYAMSVLSEFSEMEKGFVEYLRDDKNWDHYGEDDLGNEVIHEWMPSDGDKDCGCH